VSQDYSLKTIQAVRGMHDITPEQSGHWSRLEQAVAEVFSSYAYREIRMPLVESTRLFHRSIGEVTDIVEKEMYTFPDRNDESLALRPEGTAGCVRAVIENGLLNTPQKLWYSGPMFRYEKPQKGRYRQFHQIGAEVFGYPEVEVEAEMLLLNQRFWTRLGLDKNVSLQLNNIGDSDTRAHYKAALVDYLSAHKESLDADSLRRLDLNPMRILDSKNRDTQKLLNDAPQMAGFLSEASLQRVEQLNALLQSQGVKVEHNPRLVRGLDYYNDTVFEWVSNDLGAQGTVCGGGRYDGLVEQLGGKPMPAIGFAMGVERLYLLLEAQAFASLNGSDAPDAYFIVAGDQLQTFAFDLAERLRNAKPGFKIMHTLATTSMKSQFKKADKSGARFAFVIGEDEVANASVTVKDLQKGEQAQYSVADSLENLLAGLAIS
jgi:histidyl-tRNA synthetase